MFKFFIKLDNVKEKLKMINAELIYKMIEKHSDMPLGALPLLISEETPIPVPYDDIPIIVKMLERDGKIKIFKKENEEYCKVI